MDQIEAKIQAQLQDIYRQVVDADQYLEEMRKEGGAKFSDVFAEDSIFDVNSNKFQPYLAEIVAYFETWQQDHSNEEALQAVVLRMQLMLETLATLKAVRRAN